MKLTIGTRGSALALWQARHVASIIEKTHPTVKVDLITIRTQGDKILDAPLATIGGKGLFTKEIEDALLDGRVDLAVHSMKDLPTELPTGLKLAAVLEREDARDVFISADGRTLEDLPAGARIGTSSLRRKAFLLHRYPGLEVISIRGNVDTRLRKIQTENLAGIMLAAAGIIRMGFADRITEYMGPEVMIPAIGQGALALETRESDSAVEEIVAAMDHPETARCVKVERAFLQRMGGGCQVPMAAHCVCDEDGIQVTAAVVHPDGDPMIRDAYTGPFEDARVGTRLADALLSQGATSILKAVLTEDWEPGPAIDII
ncbi:MAG: hydroxymethylbilane synthase [Desulfomonile tiedjei]|nr:hydroxymethylbilane synthase [Desulfomonile tiedjei]